MNTCDFEREGAAQQAKPERDSRGRFVAGNSGGRGNPFGGHVAGLRAALLAAITDEDMQALARKLINLALAGDMAAMKLVLQYAIGKPAPAPNPDHVEIDEWDFFKKTADMTDDVPRVMKSLEPETVLSIGRELRPILAEQQVNRIREAFEKNDPSILDGKRRNRPPSTNGDFPDGTGERSDMAGQPARLGITGRRQQTANRASPIGANGDG